MVPRSIIVDIEEKPRIQHMMDGFFQERVCDLTRSGFDRNFFQIRSGEIAYHGDTITDDRVTILLYQDAVVAGVLETRTEGNHVRYDFFMNSIEDIKP